MILDNTFRNGTSGGGRVGNLKQMKCIVLLHASSFISKGKQHD